MKKNKTNKKHYNLPVTPIYFGIVVLICSLSVGYAAMFSKLSISGVVSFGSSGSIKITNVKVYEELNGAVDIPPTTYNRLTLATDFNLPNIDSQLTYEVTITNNSDSNQEYNGFTVIRRDALSVTGYEVGISEGEIINKGTSKTFIITMYYGISTLPENTIFSVDLLFLFDPTTKEDTVIADSLLLSLNGKDRIYNGAWYDRSHNKDVELVNITSNLNNNAYTFSGNNSCALTNRTTIPTTGDFTIEAQITTGSDVSGDKSIIAQEILGLSGEDGRTKPFNIYPENGINNIRMFLIGSQSNTTLTANYATSIHSNTSYHLLLTRKGTLLSLYLNGHFVVSVTLNEGDTLSNGTTQIGCYDSTSGQNFIGDIHTLRIYDRALTDEEIIQNFLSNKVAAEIEGTLIEYIIQNHITTSGDGLYFDAENERYIYKGLDPSNYLLLGGNLYRILSIEADNSLKLVKVNDIFSEIPFDASGNRTTEENPYCTNASTHVGSDYYGCNAWAISTNILGDETKYTTKTASLADFLETDIYNTFDEDTKSRIIEHDFDVGIVGSSDLHNVIMEEKAITWRGKVGTLTVSDAINAGHKSNLTDYNTDNYLINYTSDHLYLWTMNGKQSNTYDVWALVNGRAISQRRASRATQSVTSTILAYFGVLPVIYVDGNLKATGDGTIDTPFAFSE